MASSGISAWTKYFQGKGDIETRLKKDSDCFDPHKQTKLTTKFPSGTELIYLKAKKYESKALVKIKTKKGYEVVRVPFDNIAKPGVKASGAASLKPQAFGLASDSRKWSINEYTKTLDDSIDSRKDLSASVRLYLEALLNNTIGDLSNSELSKIFAKVKSDVPLNDIKKDYGEVIGPLAIRYKNLFSRKGIKISPQMKILVPLRPNEPLMDYGLYDGDSNYIISAKSGETTNVVKPKDILDLLAKNSTKLKKWKPTLQYKILETLNNGSIITGPIQAVSILYPKLIPESAVKNGKIDESKLNKFIAQNDYLSKKKKPTINEIMYECEKKLQDETKNGNLNMNEIFAAAIEPQVIYVKFDIGHDGIGNWDVAVSSDFSDIKHKKTFLRTKNGYTRASDRMGIQI